MANEQGNQGGGTEDIRSLSPDERVRRARELAAEMRRQRAAERGEAAPTPAAPQEPATPQPAAEAPAPPAAEAAPTPAETLQPLPGEPEQPPTPAQPSTAPEPEREPVAAGPTTYPISTTPPPETPFSWRMAMGPAQKLLASVRAEAAAARARTPVAWSSRQASGKLTRRVLLLGGFWTGLGLTLATALSGLDFLFPRKVVGFGGPIAVPAEQIPQPGGDPIHVIRGKFWLVNLQPGEGTYAEFGEAGNGGLLALWHKCPHLGCTVPWRSDFVFGGSTGWFRCPCHGSTYTKGGVRVFGPAPRPMDTMAIEKQADGSIIVQTGDITQGGNNNPSRAI